MPKVSVIIPVYGVEKYIERCSRSLFEQTLDDIEYLFIDDCTPDRSIEILNRVLDEYPQRKNQVKILRHDKNQGLPIARQTGLKVASGEYIAHCDSDDWVDVTMYEKMYNKVIEENADMIICGYNLTDCVDFHRKKRSYKSKSKQQYLGDLFYQKAGWAVWNRLVSRRVYQQDISYPKGNMGEDMVLTIQYVMLCQKISFIDECLYNYFFNPYSITHTQSINSVISKYKQSCENLNILVEAIGDSDDISVKHGLQWLYFRSSNTLLECFGDKVVRQLWLSHFSGKNMLLLLHPHISVLRKIRHFYYLVRCYIK